MSWILTGSDNPLYGRYNNKTDVATKVFAPIYQHLAGALTANVTNILVAGDWAIVEFTGTGTTKKGYPYSDEICWICKFEGDMIVEVSEYLDSALIKRLLEE